MENVAFGAWELIGGEEEEMTGHVADDGQHVHVPRVEGGTGHHQGQKGGAHQTGANAQQGMAIVELHDEIGGEEIDCQSQP